MNPSERPKGARYSARQLDDAFAGRLKISNTKKGSVARSAVNRATYVKRIARAEAQGFTRSQARGHATKGQQKISDTSFEFAAVPTTVGIVDLTVNSPKVARRVGQYLRDVQGLLEGRITPSSFQNRWKRRIRAVGDYELELDPERVLAQVFSNGPGPSERYRRIEARAA